MIPVVVTAAVCVTLLPEAVATRKLSGVVPPTMPPMEIAPVPVAFNVNDWLVVPLIVAPEVKVMTAVLSVVMIESPVSVTGLAKLRPPLAPVVVIFAAME